MFSYWLVRLIWQFVLYGGVVVAFVAVLCYWHFVAVQSMASKVILPNDIIRIVTGRCKKVNPTRGTFLSRYWESNRKIMGIFDHKIP